MKNYLILSILVIVSLVLLLVQVQIEHSKFWYNTLGNIANTFLISGTLTLLYQFFSKREEDQQLHQMLKISDSIQQCGLKNIHPDVLHYDFSGLLHTANHFTAIMNDGLRWFGNHTHLIEARFNRRGTVTEFFLVNPDSAFCQLLSEKVKLDHSFMQGKIRQACKSIEATYRKSHQRGELRVYYLKDFPTQSLFVTEQQVIATPYQMSPGRSEIPAFEYHYQKGVKSIGSAIYADVERIRLVCDLVVDYSAVAVRN